MKAVRAILAASVVAASAVAHAQSAAYDSIPWRTYRSGIGARFEHAQELVLQTSGAWQAFCSKAAGYPSPSAGSDVDWGKELLVAIGLGQRPTTGFSVYVESVRRIRPNEILVTYVETTPAKGQAVAEMLTSPWVVIRINRVGGNITFAKRTAQGRPSLSSSGGPRCSCGCSRCGCGAPPIVVISGGPVTWTNPNVFPGDALGIVRWRTYREGTDSRVRGFVTRVLETSGDWQAHWARSTGNAPHTAPADVDWNREKLVAIHLGQRPTGGQKVYVQTIERARSSEIQITYVVSSHATGPPTTQAFTSPYVIIRMDRTAGNLTFRRLDMRMPNYAAGGKCSCGCKTCVTPNGGI